MRKVFKCVLSSREKSYLKKWNNEVIGEGLVGNLDIEKKWKARRQTQTMDGMVQKLTHSARPPHKCMYCLVSSGTDIDHFWPKASYPIKAFNWDNFVLNCTDCGRNKSNSFPLDSANNPFLINPFEENPWEFLDFEPKSGCITPRFLGPNLQSEKGIETTKALNLAERDALTTSYKRSYLRLKERLEEFLNSTNLSSEELFNKLILADEQDILEWLLLHNGTKEPFCQAMQNDHPGIWNDLKGMYTQTFLTPP